MPTINLGRVGFVEKGAWVDGTHKVNDVVSYNNGTYACILAHTSTAGNIIPTNVTYWIEWVSPTVMHLTGNESVSGVKTFASSPIIPNATADTQAVAYNQLFAKDGSASVISSAQPQHLNYFTGTAGLSTGVLSIKITGLVTATATTVDLGFMEITITQDDRDHTSATNPATYKLMIKGNMDAGVWYNTQAIMLGSNSATPINVRFTRTATDAYIEIGETTSTWYYTTVEVSHVSSYVIAGFNPVFLATIQASLLGTTIDTIIPVNYLLNGKNYLINGGFDYWNYATSQTTSGYSSDDRWANYNVGSTKTHSQVASTDTERALFNSSKFSRTVATSVVGATNQVVKRQAIENIAKLAGKTVTISFWAKADTNKNIAIELVQNFGTGGTPSAALTSIGSQLVPLTSTWQKKSITITVPSLIGKTLGTDGVHTSSTDIYFWFDAGSSFNTRTASLGQQSGTFDIAEVKLEEGSVSTPFCTYNGEFGGEIQACQRYYEHTYTFGNKAGDATSLGAIFSINQTVSVGQGFQFKVIKRVAPTVTIYSPSGTVGTVWNASDANQGTVAANNIGTAGVRYLNNSGTGWSTNSSISYHFTASAEL